MAWFVHYWDEINNRNICSREISAREDAMRKALVKARRADRRSRTSNTRTSPAGARRRTSSPAMRLGVSWRT